MEYKLARARARGRHHLPPGERGRGGPGRGPGRGAAGHGGRALPLAPARRRDAPEGPRARRLGPRRLRRHHRARLLHGAAGGPGKRAGPRSRERAPLRRPVDARRPRRRGGRGLGHGRGPRRRLPGRGVLGGLRRGRAASADRTGSGRWPRCSRDCPRGRRSSGTRPSSTARRSGPPFATPCSRPRPSSSRRPSPLAALRLAAAGVTVPASGLRPLYLRGVDARPSPA